MDTRYTDVIRKRLETEAQEKADAILRGGPENFDAYRAAVAYRNGLKRAVSVIDETMKKTEDDDDEA